MFYFVNDVDISNTLITDASATNTNISGYKINGNDIHKLFQKRVISGYGLNYKTFGYAYSGNDIGNLFNQKIFTSSTASYDISNVSNGVVITVKGSGDLSFNFSLSKLSFAIIGAGGSGGSHTSGQDSGGGGGAGELIYGTYTSTTNFINRITTTIGLNSGEESSVVSNDNFLNITAYGGSNGGNWDSVGGGTKGSGGGGGGSQNVKGGGSAIKHNSISNYTNLANNGGNGGSNANDDGAGGGGGGAGSVGNNGAEWYYAGPGGLGYSVIFDSVTLPTIGGGGGGGKVNSNGNAPVAGTGGGGTGGSSTTNGTDGKPNTGGGGGGAGAFSYGKGGSGVLYLYIDNSYIYRFRSITGQYSLTNTEYNGTTYNVMTFTGNGTFMLNTDIAVKYMLIVGGGGSGAKDTTIKLLGGGGAGSVGIYKYTEGNPFFLYGGITYSITIGQGGDNTNGNNTVISNGSNFTEIAYGGGKGGKYENAASSGNNNTLIYGSGGGGGTNSSLVDASGGKIGNSDGVYINPPTNIRYYFKAGGDQKNLVGTTFTLNEIDGGAAGGGGAGFPGSDSTYLSLGWGGTGVQFIDTKYYGGGGGGSSYLPGVYGGPGGNGGGGRGKGVTTTGTYLSGSAGSNNTGGGGGGNYSGGSGIVKIYYL